MYNRSQVKTTYLIKPNQKISFIQKEFSTLYPFLKLEFFRKTHNIHEGSPKKDLIRSEIQLKPVHKKKNKIVVTDNMSVSILEKEFEEVFGISAQVFRKSGKIWLETSMTDDWSLKRQNDQGQELSYFV